MVHGPGRLRLDRGRAAAAAGLSLALLSAPARASLSAAEAAADAALAQSTDVPELEVSPDARVRAAAAAVHALGGDRERAARLLAGIATLEADCVFRARRAELAGGLGCQELPAAPLASAAPALPLVAAALVGARAGETGGQLLNRVLGEALGGRLEVSHDRFRSGDERVALEALLYLDDRVLLVARSTDAALGRARLQSVVDRRGPQAAEPRTVTVVVGDDVPVPPGWTSTPTASGWSHVPAEGPGPCGTAIVVLDEPSRAGNVTARRKPAGAGGAGQRVTLASRSALRRTWTAAGATCVSYELATRWGRVTVQGESKDGADEIARAVAVAEAASSKD